MSEIKKPEHQTDAPQIESKSPEKLREIESKQENNSNALESLGAKTENQRLEQEQQKETSGDNWIKTKQEQNSEKLDGTSSINKEGTEKEINKSKFDKENFSVENSYDAQASKELTELASKSNSELIPMGENTNVPREVKATYTPEEREKLKAEREKIDRPDENTIMQKVICVDSGNIQKDLEHYLNPTDSNGNETSANIRGFVAKANDVAPYTKTPQECYENLRLDYSDTPYTNSEQSVYVVRFTDGTNYEIPYNKDFGGNSKDGIPCTGNGYLASENHLIPEYKVFRDDKNQGAVVTDGVIYRISPDGLEEAVAEYNRKDECFDLIRKEH